MIRPRRKTSKASLVASIVLHGAVLLLLAGTTLLGKGCASKKPNQKLMFVEFTVAVPPAAPETEPESATPPPPEPQDSIPEPPPPDNIPEPAKKPEPPKPEPPKPPDPPKPKPPRVIKQNKRIERTATPEVRKGPRLTDREIEDLIKKGAKIGSTTSIPADADARKLGAYSNHVRDRLYAAWQQPEALKNLPGLMAVVQITIQQDGRVGNGKILKSSGNSAMDESVLKAVRTVKALRALPAGIKGPVDLEVEFELAQ